jgi:hypothetical protein
MRYVFVQAVRIVHCGEEASNLGLRILIITACLITAKQCRMMAITGKTDMNAREHNAIKCVTFAS